MKVDPPQTDLMTHYCATHVCKCVVERTAPGLEVRQAIDADERIGTLDPKLQSVWAIWDVRQNCWLDCWVDPDNVPL